MNPEEYEALIAQPDVLDGTTLNVTVKELAFVKDSALVAALQRILAHNRIEKPAPAAGAYDTSPSFYRVDLSGEGLERIIDLLNDLEEQNIGAEGSPTPMSAFYGRLADKWSALG